MALFFTGLLALSIMGMVVLLGLKRFEMATGRVVLETARPSIGAFFYSILVWVERDLPKATHRLVERGVTTGKKVLQEGVAHSLLALEHGLEQVLGLLRRTTAPTAATGSGQASAFLREVAEYKKKLLKQSRPPTTEVQQEQP